jgi:glycosyltransferase involved in cell wall biosynthesis
MASAPAATVLVAVFNGADYLSEAITSIFAQTFSDFELLVVDDGSTDQTQDIIRSFPDPRLRAIVLSQNRGIARARNAGLEAARGRYIAFLDHDDVAPPERLEKQIAFLDLHPQVGMLGSDVEFIDSRGATLQKVHMPASDLEIRWMNLLDCPMRQSSLTARRDLARQHHYNERFLSLSDWDFIQRMLENTEAANLPEVLVRYRSHPTNVSHTQFRRAVETGAHLSHHAIKSALPDFEITFEDVRDLRSVVLGGGSAGEGKSLEKTKRSLRLYLDLFEAFEAKHRDDPAVPAFNSRLLSSLHPASAR